MNSKNIYYYIFLATCIVGGIFYYILSTPSIDKNPVMHTQIEPTYTYEEPIVEIEPVLEDFEELPTIKEIPKTESSKEKLFPFTSVNAGIYTISLNTSYKMEDINQTETLQGVLKVNEDNIPFSLKINQTILKNLDTLLLRIETNTTESSISIIEDAYILQDLELETQYHLTLALYEDYIDLYLLNMGQNIEFKPIILDRNINATRLITPGLENIPVSTNLEHLLVDIKTKNKPFVPKLPF